MLCIPNFAYIRSNLVYNLYGLTIYDIEVEQPNCSVYGRGSRACLVDSSYELILDRSHISCWLQKFTYFAISFDLLTTYWKKM